jgi:metal-responsive CopG/Arc/MetJ family transcriptional regulator
MAKRSGKKRIGGWISEEVVQALDRKAKMSGCKNRTECIEQILRNSLRMRKGRLSFLFRKV